MIGSPNLKKAPNDSYSLPPHLDNQADTHIAKTIANSVGGESFGVISNYKGPEKHPEDKMDPRDPETVAQAHRHYLGALTDGLLLHLVSYLKCLRTLLVSIDQLVAFVIRMARVQRSIDMLDDGAMIDSAEPSAQEEKDIYEDMIAASHRVNDEMKQLILNLKDINGTKDRTSDIMQLLPETTPFQPWSSGSVDRLLLRLEFHVKGDNSDFGEV